MAGRDLDAEEGLEIPNCERKVRTERYL